MVRIFSAASSGISGTDIASLDERSITVRTIAPDCYLSFPKTGNLDLIAGSNSHFGSL
jgi:hypothetical protein